MGCRKTYFGLEVHTEPFGQCVYLADIEALPFHPFWLEAARGSTLAVSPSGALCVYLHDWEAFAAQFIRDGTHRHQPPQPT